MQPNARIDSKLRWFKPDYVGDLSDTRELTVSGRRAYDVDALAALRAFVYKVSDTPTAKQFVRDFGPLVEPTNGKVARSAMVATQRAIVAVWKEWRVLDARTLKQWREVAADFGAKPLPEKLLAARQAHVAPLLAGAKLSTHLAWEGGAWVLRPNDLQSAMWLVVAQRITVGDAAIPCRNADCENVVRRQLSDGDSMRAVFCEEKREACRKHVEREWARGRKEVDRYPQLRGLNATKFRDAARKLRGEEVL
jgi:hypothetical protein